MEMGSIMILLHAMMIVMILMMLCGRLYVGYVVGAELLITMIKTGIHMELPPVDINVVQILVVHAHHQVDSIVTQLLIVMIVMILNPLSNQGLLKFVMVMIIIVT